VEEHHDDPTVGLRGLDQRSKYGRSSAKDGAPERLRCCIIQKEGLDPAECVRRRCKKNSSVSSTIFGQKGRKYNQHFHP